MLSLDRLVSLVWCHCLPPIEMFALDFRDSVPRKQSPINPPHSDATFLPWRAVVRVRKISGLCERVIGQERTHIIIAEHRLDGASEQPGGSFEFRMMDGSISRW